MNRQLRKMVSLFCVIIIIAQVMSISVFANSSITVEALTVPNDRFIKGERVYIYGIVRSSLNLIKVSADVYNSSGVRVFGASESPNSTSFDLFKLDPKLTFRSLDYGTYRYVVYAEDSSGYGLNLVDKYFTVDSGELPSNIVISNETTPPDRMNEGERIYIYGGITSNYPLSTVSISVYNASGGREFGANASPNTTYYDTFNLDPQLTFRNLKAGTYRHVVYAKDSKGFERNLVEKSFTVVQGAPTPNIVLSNSQNPPDTANEGERIYISGGITSNYPLSSVLVYINDSNGNRVFGAEAKPNTTSYSITNLDSQLTFRNLKAGTYKYIVYAIDTSGFEKYLVEKNFTVVSSSIISTLSISGDSIPLDVHTQGQLFDCKGTVSSNHNITVVKLGIYNSSGNGVYTASATPNTKSYNIANLDTQIKFANLLPGSYVYRVEASDALGTSKILVEKSFTVVGINGLAKPVLKADKTTIFVNEYAIISWESVPDAKLYQVIIKKDNIIMTDGTTEKREIKVTNPNACTYSIEVRAINGNQYSDYSAPLIVKVANTTTELKPPVLHADKTSINTRETIIISWDAIPGAKKYGVTIKKDGNIFLQGETWQCQIQLQAPPKGKYSITVYTDNGFACSKDSQPIEAVVTEASNTNVHFSGFSMQSSIPYGKSYYVTSGLITSNSTITNVQVKVINSAGQNEMPNAYTSCNTTNFAFSSLDSKLTFRLLKAGTYRLEVWATVNSVANKVYEATFNVTEPSVELLGSIKMVSPIKISYRLTSPFEANEAWRTGKHRGIDLGVASGTPVFAAASGKVLRVYVNNPTASNKNSFTGATFGTYGNAVVIDHQNGFYTLYAHLRDKPTLTPGQDVTTSTQLGVVGGTNNTYSPYGAHLHFEVNDTNFSKPSASNGWYAPEPRNPLDFYNF